MLLSRPPYARWLAVIVLVAVALMWDLSRRATEPYPVAATSIAAGSLIGDGAVRWVDLPAGALPAPPLDGGRAAVDIRPGDPITPSVVTGADVVPDGWWAVPVDLPAGVPEGAPVRLLLPSGRMVDGVVAASADEDVFAGPSGAVAVPDADVDDVARSAVTGSVLVLVSP